MEIEEHDVLIRNLLQLPPTPAPRGVRMVPVVTVAPAVRFASRNWIHENITDIKQSPVTPTLVAVVAVAVEAVVLTATAPLGPPATTVTATLALGEFRCMRDASRSIH